uniref:Pectinesterase catalytic domain-containing protein n=1 Tax=Setaria viridis TaxID=4556 RepID=A0A4U6VHG2_SETVI|nr:LOW QUALITY PROTEIN: hypothetical protein SEVIR_3G362700v2 [Setaria viridis]
MSNGGRNHSATISQALAAVPPLAAGGPSARRYVIHVRSGTYHTMSSATSTRRHLPHRRPRPAGTTAAHPAATTPRPAAATAHEEGAAREGPAAQPRRPLALRVYARRGCSPGPPYQSVHGAGTRAAAKALSDDVEVDLSPCSGQGAPLAGEEGSSPSLSLHVEGSGFMARHQTIKNTVGVDAGPAVALIHLLQQCNLLIRLLAPGGQCVVMAQGRDVPNDHSSFVFQDSTVAALPGVNLTGVPIYFGRSWRNHSHGVFMHCLLEGIIHPAGWERWGDSVPVPDTIFYQNRGMAPTAKGASTGRDSTSSWMLRRRRISPSRGLSRATSGFLSSVSTTRQAWSSKLLSISIMQQQLARTRTTDPFDGLTPPSTPLHEFAATSATPSSMHVVHDVVMQLMRHDRVPRARTTTVKCADLQVAARLAVQGEATVGGDELRGGCRNGMSRRVRAQDWAAGATARRRAMVSGSGAKRGERHGAASCTAAVTGSRVHERGARSRGKLVGGRDEGGAGQGRGGSGRPRAASTGRAGRASAAGGAWSQTEGGSTDGARPTRAKAGVGAMRIV